MLPRILVPVCLVLLCIVAIGGCGDDRPELLPVSGVVTLDGKPLDGATVVFSPVEGGRGSRGRTDHDGRYTLIYLRDIEGAIPGEHKVRIITAGEGTPVEKLPAKYNTATTLHKEVAPESKAIDFALESK